MKKTVIQVFGFLISTLGWFFVCCTLAMEHWRITYIGGQGGAWIIKAAWYYSNLWRDCYTDTSAVDNCRDYDVLWVINPTNTAERGFIQTVRGLLLFGMAVGFFAAIFCFVGMDCTYIGGSERTNDVILLTGAFFHFIGGVADAAAYSFFTIKLGRANFIRLSTRGFLRYQIGPPIYLGFAGCFCIILGSILYAVTVYRTIVPKREADPSKLRNPMSTKTYVPLAKSKSLYNGERAPSAQSKLSRPISQSSSQVSRISRIPDASVRDAFV